VKRKVASTLPLLAAVCLLALAFPSPAPAQRQGNKASQSNKATTKSNTQPATKPAPKADVTLSATAAPRVDVVTPSASFLSPLEKEILDEMNLARTEPQKYAAFVEEYKKYYDGNRLMIPGRKKALVTNDGVAAVDEAIKFLRAQQPLPAFEVSKGVSSAAADHAKDLATSGINGHKGSDGSLPNARVDRYGRWEGAIGETLVYELSPARQVIIALIIDDGVPTRGHRRNIFDPNYKITGISVSDPLSFGSKCVIDYVGGFKEKAPSTK
jgi:uncharacterized protein YkwD